LAAAHASALEGAHASGNLVVRPEPRRLAARGQMGDPLETDELALVEEGHGGGPQAGRVPRAAAPAPWSSASGVAGVVGRWGAGGGGGGPAPLPPGGAGRGAPRQCLGGGGADARLGGEAAHHGTSRPAVRFGEARVARHRRPRKSRHRIARELVEEDALATD